jgi:hypothetical protein
MQRLVFLVYDYVSFVLQNQSIVSDCSGTLLGFFTSTQQIRFKVLDKATDVDLQDGGIEGPTHGNATYLWASVSGPCLQLAAVYSMPWVLHSWTHLFHLDEILTAPARIGPARNAAGGGLMGSGITTGGSLGKATGVY